MQKRPRNTRNKRHHTPEHSDLLLILLLVVVGVVIGFVADAYLRPQPPQEQHAVVQHVTATPQPGELPAATATPAPTMPPAADGVPATPPPQPTSMPDLAGTFFDAQRFSYTPDFYTPEIQAVLAEQPGDLKEVRFQIGDRSQSFAETLVVMSSLYSINPKVVLALMVQHGYTHNDAALYQRFYQMVIELRHSVRDYALSTQTGSLPDLVFQEEGQRQAITQTISMPRYAISRVLAKTTSTPEELPGRLQEFQGIYMRLFGDPRQPPQEWPPPAEPFLSRPMEQPHRITSVFDHETPFLHRDGSTYSYWGYADAALPYDGHTGWDYAMKPPEPVLAAADGVVVFAGNSDDGCYTPARAVIVEHGNGYRTLYWHLSAVSVETGQHITNGTQLGIAGNTGCSFGPHLHFQVQYLGRDVDPYGWCGRHADPWEQNPTGQQSTWLWQDMMNPCGEPPADAVVVDAHLPGFASSGGWQQVEYGYGGSAHYLGSIHLKTMRPAWELRPLVATPAVATWQPDLPHAGRYRVLAYIPHVLNGLDDSQAVRYRIHHHDGEDEVLLNAEAYANSWADLGTYYFGPHDTPLVSLSVLAGDTGRGIWADAMVWQPVE